MNEQEHRRTPAREVAPRSSTARAVRLDAGRTSSAPAASPSGFENPGLPAARRTGWPTSTRPRPSAPRSRSRPCSALSMLGTLAFIVAYFAIDLDHRRSSSPASAAQPVQPRPRRDHGRLGLLGIGFGAVHWAKTLMPDEEVVEERHPLRVHRRVAPRPRSSGRSRRAARRSQLARRPLIKYTLGGALGLFALPLVAAGRRLPRPDAAGRAVAHVLGRSRTAPASPVPPLMRDPESTPIKAERRHHRLGLPRHAGGPATDPSHEEHVLEEKAKATVILMRLDPRTSTRAQKQRDWGYDGHRRLLQDLHPRRMPGGPLRAADPPPAVPVPPVDLRRHAGLQGHLRPGASARCRSCRSPSTTRATSSPPQPFTEPVGPSFWERLMSTSTTRPADALRERRHAAEAAPSAPTAASAASPAGSTTAPASPSQSATC